MSLIETFMELDKLYEATISRQELISNLKALGKNYNFDIKTDAQLYRIWEKAMAEKKEQDAYKEYHQLQDCEVARHRCPECGLLLADDSKNGCPVCDNGEEHFS